MCRSCVGHHLPGIRKSVAPPLLSALCARSNVPDQFRTANSVVQEVVCEMKNFVFAQSGKYLAAILFLLLWFLAQTFSAGTVPLKSAPIILAWDPANDPSVQGYGIYYGPTNQLATNYINAGTNLTVTLFDLRADTGHWFYAVSYDAAGNESVPSNPLLLTPPALSPVRIAQSVPSGFRLTLQAASGSVCQLEYADTPNSSTWLTLGTATADANGNLAVIDSISPQRPSRFYRAVRLVNLPLSAGMQLQQ